MNICIISSGNSNNYSIKLTESLLNNSIKPKCLIIVEKKSYFGSFKQKVKKTLKGNSESISLSKICRSEKINLLMVKNINSQEAINFVKENNIDFLVYTSGGILRKEIIKAPKNGVLNAHMGDLPSFRGMNVLEWSLFQNHKIGVTLHFIDPGIDTGDILLFKEIPIKKADTIDSLRNKSREINLELIHEGLKRFKDGTIKRITQKPEDGKQYFVMHPRLKAIAEQKINSYMKLT